MAWFHPKTLLDKTYEIGIAIKGIDGSLELLGGILVLAIPRHTIYHLTDWLTRNELSNDPHDFIANKLAVAGHHLATGSHIFTSVFLLTHGIVKVALVVALLRQKHWAYPWAIGALTLFLIYQVYLLIVKPTFSMAFLTVLDIVIIGLIYREWSQVKATIPKSHRSDGSIA